MSPLSLPSCHPITPAPLTLYPHFLSLLTSPSSLFPPGHIIVPVLSSPISQSTISTLLTRQSNSLSSSYYQEQVNHIAAVMQLQYHFLFLNHHTVSLLSRTGYAVGSKLSYADMCIWNLLNDYFDNTTGVRRQIFLCYCCSMSLIPVT